MPKNSKSKIDRFSKSLSPEQRRVFRLLMLGKSNREIAQKLGCTDKNVEYHVAKLLQMTRTPSRTKLLVKMLGP